jgi:hypothetical protein
MTSARRLAAVVLVATLTGAATTAPAQASQRTHAVAHCTDVSIKPAHYIFTCADGGIGLRKATYTKWGTSAARGSATYFYNDCKPSCAGGTFHFRKATFRLYRVVETKKYGPLFTRVEVATKTHDHVYQLPTWPI